MWKFLALLIGSLLLLMAIGATGSERVPQVLKSSDSNESLASVAEDAIEEFFGDSGSRFLIALHNMSMYLPLSVDYAVTVGNRCDIVEYNKPFYHVPGLIIAAILILLGSVFTFFGYRLIKIVLFLIGFIIGGALAYFLVLAVTYDRDESWIPYVAAGVAVLVGILCGLLTICIYYVGIFLAGGSIGFLIIWFILGAIDVSFFRTHIYVPILISVLSAIIVGIVALLIQKWLFMLGSSILGAFLVTWGLDYYIELGAMVYYLLLFAEHRSTLKPCWYSWSIIPFFGILAIAGFLVQALLTGRKYNHKEHMNVCCGICKKKKKKETKKVDEGGKYMKLKDMGDDDEKPIKE